MPHYIVLAFSGAVVVTVLARFAILFHGHISPAAVDFVVGVGRWATRVWADAFLLSSDAYPPFSLS